MFTLKLYRHIPGTLNIIKKIYSVDHVESIQIAENTIELRTFAKPDSPLYEFAAFYVGERKDDMTAVNSENHWEWGLLENATGKTTEHFRPHTYG